MKKKLFIIATIARTLYFFKGQPRIWKNSFDVCAIAAEKDTLINFSNDEGIESKYIPMKREISIVSDFMCLIRFILLFAKERPHIVHGNTPKASMLSMVAAWLTCRPVRIYMCHGLRYETASGALLRVLKTMEWISCHCATQVIGVSQGVVDRLMADGLCRKDKIKVVGYGTAGGIDLERFSRNAIGNESYIRQDLNISDDAFIFSFVGRIVKDKGINELVAAFDKLSKLYSNIHLFLIGPNEDADPISIETKDIIASNIRIYPIGRQEDVRPYIAASDALVLPSYREGLGQVILEANALDVPCIASDIIGPRDVIKPLVNGELVQPRNADALFDKMKEWVEEPDRVSHMALSSRNFVETRFDQELVKEAYYVEYCKLANL